MNRRKFMAIAAAGVGAALVGNAGLADAADMRWSPVSDEVYRGELFIVDGMDIITDGRVMFFDCTFFTTDTIRVTRGSVVFSGCRFEATEEFRGREVISLDRFNRIDMMGCSIRMRGRARHVAAIRGSV